MCNLIGRILTWLGSSSLKLLTLAGLIFVIWGTLAPLETLVWWIAQEEESLGIKRSENKRSLDGNNSNPPTSKIDCYVVFLPGVGSFDADNLTDEEASFLERVIEQHPSCVPVEDVFPYSAANKGLVGERLLAPVWNWISESDGLAYTIINIRNIWRLAISADDRYGPVYNRGIASAIINRMNAAHPIPSSQRESLKVIVMSTSGGAQVALGATPYLDDWLNAPIYVISIGGVFAGTDGFDQAQYVFHLYSDKDWIDNIGNVVFPSRWPWTVSSPYNRARRQGRYQAIETGPHEHDGSKGFFGEETAQPDGTTYVDMTLEHVNQLPIWK